MSHCLAFIEPQKQWVKFIVTITYFKVLLKNVKGTWSLGFLLDPLPQYFKKV